MKNISAKFCKEPYLIALTLILGCFFFRFFFFLFKICPQYIDIDQTLMWYGTVCFANGNFPEPNFFGQSYGLMLESLGAVPLYFAGIPLYCALPAATMLLTFAPFLFLSIKCRKNHPLLAVIILSLYFISSNAVDLLFSVPRALAAGYIFAVIGAVLVSEGKTPLKIFTGTVSIYIGILAVSPSVLMFIAAMPFAWKNGLFREKNKWKIFLAGNITGVFLLLSSTFFYILFPDHHIHREPLFPAGIIYFLDNLHHTGDLLEMLFPVRGILIYAVPVLLAGILILLWYRKKYIAFAALSGCFFLILPILFFFSRTNDYIPHSLLFGMHRFYLFLFPLTALILYLSKDENSPSHPPKKIWFLLIVLAVLFLTIYKISNFPPAKVPKAASWEFYAQDTLPRLMKKITICEEQWKKLSPEHGLIVPSSALSYALAAHLYGRTTVFLPNYERKTADYYKAQKMDNERKFLFCFITPQRLFFHQLTLPPGKSLQMFFNEKFYNGLPDEREMYRKNKNFYDRKNDSVRQMKMRKLGRYDM